jgi:Protein of unknown function (DUF3768)
MEALEAETIRQRIATLNDQFRAKGLGNGWLLSQAVRSLDAETLVKLLGMIQQQQFIGSAEGNDAYGEHDFGSIALGRDEEYFWKIDYFDHEQKFHSADPSNPCVTRRVMTVMKADEDEVAKRL